MGYFKENLRYYIISLSKYFIIAEFIPNKVEGSNMILSGYEKALFREKQI